MICYKLTDENMCTYQGTPWVLGEWRETSGEGELCGSGWLHCYEHPFLAALLNPIHVNFSNPRLFECECAGECKTDGQLKRGYTRMRLTKENSWPRILLNVRVRFAILCAKEICKDATWNTWAEAWLSGENRSAEAAWAAAGAAWAAAEAAAWAAARAAGAAAWATWATAEAAGAVARAAAWAAARAAWAINIDLVAIAERAIAEENNI